LIEKVQDITYTPPDHIDKMPPYIVQDINVKLPPDLHDKYNELKKTFLLGEIEAVNAADKLLKLMQFCNGAIYTNPDAWDTSKRTSPMTFRKYDTFHDLKLNALEELVDSLQGSPLLVFYNFLSDKRRIVERITHSVTMADSPINEVIDRWNRGKIQVLLAHAASAGHGLNLQHGGHHVAWFGLSFDLELYEQANGRLRRTGQEKPVTIHRILIENSVEQGIALVLVKKGQTQQDLIKSVATFCKGIPVNLS
jgi:SNF2 family DNA or RNA helicase